MFGSGTHPDPYAHAAGKAIAASGHDLLTGGGPGAMNSALDGFLEVAERSGVSYAILPRHQYEPSGYDHVIRTAFDAPKDLGRSPYSRNLVNVAFCHGCIFVSDTPGTLTEVIWMHRLGKPSAFLGPEQTWQSAKASLNSAGSDSDILLASLENNENLDREAKRIVDRLLQTLAQRI